VRISRPVDIALAVVRIVLILCMLPFAIGWRTPLFAGWRYTALAVLIIAPLLLIAIEIWTLRRARHGGRAIRILSGAALSLAVIAFGATGALELQFQYQRYIVLRADPDELERLGRHLLVGYRSEATLQALMERRAIAGVFVSARNAQGKTADALRREIQALQERRRQQGLLPLWVATDQEGGGVSRLSPPLTRMPTLAEVVALHQDRAERQLAVRQYAGRQGRELASIGVNLNFAPVVDLNHGIVNPDDRLTRISQRAISDDPSVVTEAADLYCSTLLLTGVHCTLKHFPGLGRVYEDTHRVTAELATGTDELAATDWLPFHTLMANRGSFTMLGHARLTAVDRDRPASFSGPVVRGLLRDTWGHEGVLITDDFSMGAVTLVAGGAARGAIDALNAGVDLILVSYDPDQYFPVMHALLTAGRDGRLQSDMLERSTARLKRAAADGKARHSQGRSDQIAAP
jgi:beta-N-acetylhexosaminidase